jgi:hypothetical protein
MLEMPERCDGLRTSLPAGSGWSSIRWRHLAQRGCPSVVEVLVIGACRFRWRQVVVPVAGPPSRATGLATGARAAPRSSPFSIATPNRSRAPRTPAGVRERHQGVHRRIERALQEVRVVVDV